MKCNECKYWSEKDKYDTTPKEIRECLKPKPLWECTDWDNDYKRTIKENCKNMKMFVQDGSDYTAHLFTKEDFFCAEFEAK